MKIIRQILFLGCVLLNVSVNMLNAVENEKDAVAILDIIKFGNNPSQAFEFLADFFLKTSKPQELNFPQLKCALFRYKEYIDTGIETFKKLPVEVRKAGYKAACGAKAALTKMKQDMLDTIKSHKAIIAEYEKKEKELAVLSKKDKKTEKEVKTHATLTKELQNKGDDYRESVKELKDIEEKYSKMDFSKLEEWANHIKSIAYWNSGSGFFEQFWNLNWSGKLLTFVGTPLACYGAYKLYNDYLSADADQSLVEEIQDKAQDVKNNLELAKVVVKQKLQ